MNFAKETKELAGQSDIYVLSQTSPVESLEPDFAAALRDLYSDSDVSISILGSLYNSIFTQKTGAFLMSFKLMKTLIKSDANARLKDITDAQYRYFMKRLVYNGRIFKPILPPKEVEKNKAKPLLVIDPNFITYLSGFIEVSDVNRQVEDIIAYVRSDKPETKPTQTVTNPQPIIQTPVVHPVTPQPELDLNAMVPTESYVDACLTMADDVISDSDLDSLLEEAKRKAKDSRFASACASKCTDSKSYVFAEKNFELCISQQTISEELLKIRLDRLDWVRFLYSYKINNKQLYNGPIAKEQYDALRTVLVDDTAQLLFSILKETRSKDDIGGKYSQMSDFIARNGPVISLPLINKLIESLFNRDGRFESLIYNLEVQLASRYTESAINWVSGALDLLIACSNIQQKQVGA